MKKLILEMLFATVMIVSMTACEDNSPNNNQVKQTETQTPETVPELEKSTEAGQKEDSEALLMEQNGIEISYSGLEDTTSGIDLKINIKNENNFTCTIKSQNVTVNGIMVSSDFSCDVAEGAKTSSALTITTSELEINSITAIEKVGITFTAIDESGDTLFTSDPIMLSKIKKGLIKML